VLFLGGSRTFISRFQGESICEVEAFINLMPNLLLAVYQCFISQLSTEGTFLLMLLAALISLLNHQSFR
jgi:hypothetical protein